ncbi:hypothetical protein LTS18_011260, partial [Coniosporium uncinatum]
MDSVFDMLDSLQYDTAPADTSREERTFPVPARIRIPQESQYFHSSQPQPTQPREYTNYEYELQEEPSMYDSELPFDSFDNELIRMPHDRASQAAQGRARLTLPPSTSRPSPGPHSILHHTHQYEVTRQDCPRAPRQSLSQFAYSPAAVQHSGSSDFMRGVPSSSALKASQRCLAPRLEYNTPPQRQIQRQVQDEEGMLEDTAPMVPQDSKPAYLPAGPKPINLPHAPKLVQGIELISTRELPDRFRSVFTHPNFNAMQSKCFHTVYRTNDNFVLSSPTGSGKTVILELTVCRLILGFQSGQYKVVYQAPTKSLCSERQRDWQKRFGPLGLECAELTGDTSMSELRTVQNASIIVTTPEKWDSMTRRWKDHEKLMKLVKLFLIDEVHILKEDRGATLEAVVSRMKSVGSDVRFVALSATVPNSKDIAAWLGKDPMNQHIPAPRERFGEEFRPVKLQKHVCGYQSPANDFAFEKTLDSKLFDVISKYSHRKPIMVFCATRKSTVATAKLLANWWAGK